MSADPNLQFMARLLAQSDFPDGEIAEVDGGISMLADGLYVATWNPALISDPDEFVEQMVATAGPGGLRRWLLFDTPGDLSTSDRQAVADSLFLCGLEQSSAAPDNIQVLGKPSFRSASGIEVAAVDPGDQTLFGLLSAGQGEEESLGYDLGGISTSPVTELAFAVATDSGNPAGAVAWRNCGVLSRICWIRVIPDARNRGIGNSLVEYACARGAESGAPVSCVWTSMKGTLRYFFARRGYADQLTIRTFTPA